MGAFLLVFKRKSWYFFFKFISFSVTELTTGNFFFKVHSLHVEAAGLSVNNYTFKSTIFVSR